MNTSRRLTRSTTDRIVAGVAGGIANYLDIDPTLVRLGFVLLVLVGGVSPLVYLVLWAVLPSEANADQPFLQQVRDNAAEMTQRATDVAHKVSDQVNQLVGDQQAKQGVQGQHSATTDQSQQVNGPATGPTQRL